MKTCQWTLWLIGSYKPLSPFVSVMTLLQNNLEVLKGNFCIWPPCLSIFPKLRSAWTAARMFVCFVPYSSAFFFLSWCCCVGLHSSEGLLGLVFLSYLIRKTWVLVILWSSECFEICQLGLLSILVWPVAVAFEFYSYCGTDPGMAGFRSSVCCVEITLYWSFLTSSKIKLWNRCVLLVVGINGC